MDNAILEIVLRARDEASATIKNLKTALADVKPGADIVTGAMIGMGVAVVGASAYSVKMATDFQSAMALIQTQAGGSAQEVKNMSAAVLNLAGETATAPKTLADGLFYVESAGYRGAQALDILKLAAEGAKVGHADLAQTANVLTTVMSSNIKGVSNASDAMGVLNATVGAGKMKMQDLVDAMSTGILPAAQGAGISMQQLGATLAVFTNNGVPAVDASSRLKMAIAMMADPAPKAVDALKTIGISSSQLATDMQHGGIMQAVQDLHDHMKNLSAVGKEQLFGQTFGVREGATMMTLVGNVDQLKDRLKQVQGAGGDFGGAWAKTSQNASMAFSKLGVEMQVLAIDFGNKLLPAITNVTNYLANNLVPAVMNMANWVDKNKVVLEILAGIITGVVLPAWLAYQAQVLVKGALEVIKFIATEWQWIAVNTVKAAQITIAIAQWIIYNGIQVAGTAITIAATAATWLFNAALLVLTSPITLVILAIIAVIAIGVLLITHWKLVQTVAKTVFDDIGNFFKNLETVVHGVVNTIIQDIKNMVNSIIDGVNTLINGVNSISGKIPGIGGKIQIPDIPHFDQGGYVPATGIAVVHQGEFVLSRAMLSGQQNVPSQISQATTNNNTPINIYATIDQDIDMNLLGQKIAFALRNSR